MQMGFWRGKQKKPECRSLKSVMISGDEEAMDTFHPITLFVFELLEFRYTPQHYLDIVITP